METSRAYLDMADVATRLHEAQDACEAPWLLVSIDVPFSSQWAWQDDYGAPRSAHLPVAVRCSPRDEPPEPERDGEAYEFALARDGGFDVREIYAEAIAWGERRYSSAEPVGDVPAVPAQIMPVVEQLLD